MELEEERYKLLMVDLPNVIHRIIHLSMIPPPARQTFIESAIADIKKITNAECENALGYLEKLH